MKRLIVVSLFVILLIVVFVGVLWTLPAKSSRQISQEDNNESLADEEAYKKAEWIQYYDEGLGVEISYPGDWSLTNDGFGVSISRGGYVFKIASRAVDSKVCLYEPGSESERTSSIEFVNYTEINSGNNSYRRGITPEIEQLDESERSAGVWRVCRKNELGVFSTDTGYGEISYTGPLNSDPAVLSVLDKILTSARFSN